MMPLGQEGGRAGGAAAGLRAGPRLPSPLLSKSSRQEWITLVRLGFLVNCFHPFSPDLSLEEVLFWGARSIFQAQGRTSAKAETTAPLPRLLPGLSGSCSSSAHKDCRCGEPSNHHSQEALRRRNVCAQLPMATVAVPQSCKHRSSFSITFAFSWRPVMTQCSLIGSASEAVVQGAENSESWTRGSERRGA